jgi:GDSL-like lipase/acylhydrolase family protein
MTRSTIRFSTLIALFGVAALCGQSKWQVPENFKNLKSYIEAPVFPEVRNVPGLPRVLIIGDSISMYYTPEVRRLLEGKANVYRAPDNGKSTMYGLQNIENWLGDGNWAVIHFNFGLHDIVIMPTGKQQVPIGEYEKNLRQLLKTLQATGAKLIWASTTPAPEGSRNRNEVDVVAYNAVARKVMDENRVPVDDLHAFVDSRPDKSQLQYPANVHFRAEASVLLGQEVTKHIIAVLNR